MKPMKPRKTLTQALTVFCAAGLLAVPAYGGLPAVIGRAEEAAAEAAKAARAAEEAQKAARAAEEAAEAAKKAAQAAGKAGVGLAGDARQNAFREMLEQLYKNKEEQIARDMSLKQEQLARQKALIERSQSQFDAYQSDLITLHQIRRDLAESDRALFGGKKLRKSAETRLAELARKYDLFEGLDIEQIDSYVRELRNKTDSALGTQRADRESLRADLMKLVEKRKQTIHPGPGKIDSLAASMAQSKPGDNLRALLQFCEEQRFTSCNHDLLIHTMNQGVPELKPVLVKPTLSQAEREEFIKLANELRLEVREPDYFREMSQESRYYYYEKSFDKLRVFREGQPTFVSQRINRLEELIGGSLTQMPKPADAAEDFKRAMQALEEARKGTNPPQAPPGRAIADDSAKASSPEATGGNAPTVPGSDDHVPHEARGAR